MVNGVNQIIDDPHHKDFIYMQIRTEKKSMPKRYCITCGRKLTGSMYFVSYDGKTGKPTFYWNLDCPINKYKWFFNKHETEESYQDY